MQDTGRRSATSGRRSGVGRRGRAAAVDFELAEQIVTAAETQWARRRERGTPMPLTLVLQTYNQVFRARGDDPVRADQTLYKVRTRALDRSML